jgi:hypothetical protein
MQKDKKMAKKTYIVVKDFQSPQVYSTGFSHKPAQVGMRTFKKGTTITGELKTANGKPSFILVGRMTVVPIECVKEVVARSIEGSSSFDAVPEKKPLKDYMETTPSKVKYMDAAIIGALVGGLGYYALEKKDLVPNDSNKYRLYAAGASAALAIYLVYRYNNRKVKIKAEKK